MCVEPRTLERGASHGAPLRSAHATEACISFDPVTVATLGRNQVITSPPHVMHLIHPAVCLTSRAARAKVGSAAEPLGENGRTGRDCD